MTLQRPGRSTQCFIPACWARYHFSASAPLRDKNSGELKIHPGAEKILHVSASEEGWARAPAWWSQGLHNRGEELRTPGDTKHSRSWLYSSPRPLYNWLFVNISTILITTINSFQHFQSKRVKHSEEFIAWLIVRKYLSYSSSSSFLKRSNIMWCGVTILLSWNIKLKVMKMKVKSQVMMIMIQWKSVMMTNWPTSDCLMTHGMTLR